MLRPPRAPQALCSESANRMDRCGRYSIPTCTRAADNTPQSTISSHRPTGITFLPGSLLEDRKIALYNFSIWQPATLFRNPFQGLSMDGLPGDPTENHSSIFASNNF